MPGILKTIQDAVPFLEAYPPWVRAFVAVGLVIIGLTAALMVAVVIAVPRAKPPVGFPDTAPTPSSSPATQPDTSTTLPAQPVRSPVIAPQETPPAALEPQARSPVSLADTLHTLSRRDLTDLQKQAFCDKHAGKLVEWQAHIASVGPERPSVGILGLISLQERYEPGNWDLVPVWFALSHKVDLLDLSAGDAVTVYGTLDFDGTKPSLSGAQVLRRQKAMPVQDTRQPDAPRA